jgi:hypothetical protein
VIRFQKFVDKDDVEYLTDNFDNKKIFQVATVEKAFLPKVHHEHSPNPNTHPSAHHLLQGHVRSSK